MKVELPSVVHAFLSNLRTAIVEMPRTLELLMSEQTPRCCDA